MKESRIKRLKKKWQELEYGTRILFQSLPKNKKNFVIGLVTVMVISGLALGIRARSTLLAVKPIPGGEWKEGIVGSARFINPVLAVSNTDKDLTALVHAGLIRRLPDGTYTGDLAESYEIDKSGLVYTFIIKEGAEFHDGKEVTADDVVYTIDRIKDPLEKSPRNVEWQGVTVRSLDERTVVFTLKQPFADFLDIATVGIIPKHIYGKYSADAFAQAEENIEAIGAGPYKIKSVKTKKNMPVSIKLEKAYRGSDNGYIKKMTFDFFESETEAIKALEAGDIEHIGGVTAKSAKDLEDKGYPITLASFPRLYGIFFNTKNSDVLKQPKITEVVASGIEKDQVIESVLSGFAEKIDTPLPVKLQDRINMPWTGVDIEKTLKNQGWSIGDDGIWEKKISIVQPGSKKAEESTEKLGFTITTSDTPELRAGAEEIARELRSKGILVSVTSYDGTTLEEKIRTRNYEALYYGVQISRESQVYAFWHSSQREHPGLNISDYANSRADSALENLQKETNEAVRLEEWKKFVNAFYSDVPAVFIYSPSYIYVHKSKLPFEMLSYINTGSDRFINIRDWYLETERVIPFLYKNKKTVYTDNL